MRSLVAAAALAATLPGSTAYAQWVRVPTGTTAEFRGLHAAGPNAVWAAGSGGTFARSTDAGRSWHADTIPGASQLFLIDVHAVDSVTAYILGTRFDGGLARVYKTSDGGTSWTLQLEVDEAGAFFDGLAFWDDDAGIAFGDPLDGTLAIVVTIDGGATWRRIPPAELPASLPGEAGFAASGTAITIAPPGSVWIGTGGGSSARVFRSADRGATWSVADTPLPAGPTAGIFGVAFRDARNGIAVGGDHQQRTADSPNVVVTSDAGATWSSIGATRPAGVRYGIAAIPGTHAIVAVGPSGSGYSTDFGASWTVIDTTHVNTAFFLRPDLGWAAGPGGAIFCWSGAQLR